MRKNVGLQNIPNQFPHRYICVETLLILFPELKDRLGEVPTQVVNGNITYDVLAAVDVFNANRPRTSDTDDPADSDTAFGDHTDI